MCVYELCLWIAFTVQLSMSSFVELCNSMPYLPLSIRRWHIQIHQVPKEPWHRLHGSRAGRVFCRFETGCSWGPKTVEHCAWTLQFTRWLSTDAHATHVLYSKQTLSCGGKGAHCSFKLTYTKSTLGQPPPAGKRSFSPLSLHSNKCCCCSQADCPTFCSVKAGLNSIIILPQFPALCPG